MNLGHVAACLALVAGCKGNGHVEQIPFVAQAGDDVVNCACNLSFDHSSCTGGTCEEHLEVKLCLPAELMRSSNPAPDGGVDDYALAVDEYCRTTVTNTVYHLITVFNGSWCDYKKPYAPDGGVGSSVVCFAQPWSEDRASATGRDDGSCEQTCPEVECDFHSNCGEDVQDDFGNVDLAKCQCSRIIHQGRCPGDLERDFPTPLFCRPPEGVALR